MHGELGSVYFIQAGEDGPVKIGWTGAAIAKRLGALQPGNWLDLRIIGSIPNQIIDTEAAWHERFAEHRIRSEWFAPAPELLTAIAEASAAEPMAIVTPIRGQCGTDVVAWMKRNGINYKQLGAMVNMTPSHVRVSLHNYRPPHGRIAHRLEKATQGEITAAALMSPEGRRMAKAAFDALMSKRKARRRAA